MKKKSMLLLTLFFMSFSPALAQIFRVGGLINYYSVEDPVYKEVYKKGNLMPGIFTSVNLGRISFMLIELRAEANYFQAQGEMTLTKEKVRFSLTPIVVGVRLLITRLLNKINVYLGGGIDFCPYKEKVPERLENVSKSGVGYHIDVGSYIYLTSRFFLDLSIRKIKLDVKPFDETVKLGGVRAGIGFGYRF